MVSDSSNSAEGADGTDVDSDADADVAAQPPDELYDEQADDKDEAWAAVVRQGRQSAAILSCPCCLETLCLDCQQCVVTWTCGDCF